MAISNFRKLVLSIIPPPGPESTRIGNQASRDGGVTLLATRLMITCALFIIPASTPILAGPHLAGATLWRNFSRIDRLPESAPRYRGIRHAVIGIPYQTVSAVLARFHPKMNIDFLGKRLGLPGNMAFLYLYPVAREGRASGGIWHFSWADKTGTIQTKLIPVGPAGVVHHLTWSMPKVRGRPLPKFPGIAQRDVVIPGRSVYVGAWSSGMARVSGWIPNSAKSFSLSLSGVRRNRSLRAFALSVEYSELVDYSAFLGSARQEWPRRAALWPPDRIVICESFWPFPSARFGAGEVVSKAMLASGLSHAQVAQALTTAEQVLKRLSPEESFLLQISGVTPSAVLHAGKTVRRAVMLLAQASFYRYFRRSSHFTAATTSLGGKNLYAVACFRKNLATRGAWSEYNLCFTKTGRLWCIGHQRWKTGQRTPVQLAAMAVNLSGLSESLAPGVNVKR